MELARLRANVMLSLTLGACEEFFLYFISHVEL
jgi:hypothetical protein